MKLIKKLFSKGYLPYKKFRPKKKNKNILTDSRHEEFRKALMEEMSRDLAETYHKLTPRVKNLEENGELKGVIKVWEKLIYWFSKEAKAELDSYVDPIAEIKDDVKAKYKNKPEPRYVDPVKDENDELEEKFAKQKEKT